MSRVLKLLWGRRPLLPWRKKPPLLRSIRRPRVCPLPCQRLRPNLCPKHRPNLCPKLRYPLLPLPHPCLRLRQHLCLKLFLAQQHLFPHLQRPRRPLQWLRPTLLLGQLCPSPHQRLRLYLLVPKLFGRQCPSPLRGLCRHLSPKLSNFPLTLLGKLRPRRPRLHLHLQL